jgi:RNA methyltransferase, TrmH family
VEGRLQLEEALSAGAEILEVFTADSEEGAAAEALCTAHRLHPYRIDPPVGRALARTAVCPDVVAVVRSPGLPLESLPEDADLVLVLAEVRDPGNAGTLIRSAAAAGADAVIFSARAVDPLSSKAVRSAAGAIFRVRLVLNVDLDLSLSLLRQRGFFIAATDARAPMAPEECDMTGRLALVLGNEARGVPAGLDRLVDSVIGIPMPGASESLNVAVAGSILLFESVRQRRGSRGP